MAVINTLCNNLLVGWSSVDVTNVKNTRYFWTINHSSRIWNFTLWSIELLSPKHCKTSCNFIKLPLWVQPGSEEVFLFPQFKSMLSLISTVRGETSHYFFWIHSRYWNSSYQIDRTWIDDWPSTISNSCIIFFNTKIFSFF